MPNLEREREREREIQTDRQTDKQIDRQTYILTPLPSYPLLTHHPLPLTYLPLDTPNLESHIKEERLHSDTLPLPFPFPFPFLFPFPFP